MQHPQTNILQQYNNNYTYNSVNPPSNSFAAESANNNNIMFEYGNNGTNRIKSMKKIVFCFLMSVFCIASYGQVHKVINGDKRYMICYDKGFFGIHCHPKDSLADGKWIFYYDSAMTKVQYIQHYKDGKRNGIAFWYGEDGAIPNLNEYKNGLLNGETRSYYANGQLFHKGFHYNREPIGEYVVYDSIGNIVRYDTNTIPKGVSYRKPFIVENAVNKLFVLNNTLSFQNILSILNKDTSFLFCNTSKNQYFIAYLNENKEFSYFEIGYIKPSSKEQYFKLDYPVFSTENGIKLGMTRTQLLAIKGTDFYVMTEEYVRYIIDKQGKVMTNQNDEIKYVLECEFDNDKIVKIKLGTVPHGAKRQSEP